MNYFELFDLPFRASIDHTGVQKKYIQLQKNFTPIFIQSLAMTSRKMLKTSRHILIKPMAFLKIKIKRLNIF